MVVYDEFGPRSLGILRGNHDKFINGSKPWHKGRCGVYSGEVLRRMNESAKRKWLLPHTEFKKGHSYLVNCIHIFQKDKKTNI